MNFLRLIAVSSALSLTLLLGIGCSPNPTQAQKKHNQKGSRSKKGSTPSPYSSALGMANLGNTCFANSVHKLLWAARRYSSTPSSHPSMKSDYDLLLNDLENNAQVLATDPNTVKVDANGYRSQLAAFYSHFRGINIDPLSEQPSQIRQDQVDAYVYLGFLSSDRTPSPFHLEEHGGGFLLKKQTRFLSDGFLNEPRIEQSQFNDGTRPRFVLSLDISSDQVHNTQEAFNHFLTPEQDMYARGNTHEQGTSTPYLILDNSVQEYPEAPQSLFLHINRFVFSDGHGRKVMKVITPSEEIRVPFHVNPSPLSVSTLFSFLDSAATFGSPVPLEQETSYSLKGVAVHLGNINGGHYVTYLKEANNNWVLHNDENVSILNTPKQLNTAHNIIARNGYLFLYMRNP